MMSDHVCSSQKRFSMTFFVNLLKKSRTLLHGLRKNTEVENLKKKLLACTVVEWKNTVSENKKYSWQIKTRPFKSSTQRKVPQRRRDKGPPLPDHLSAGASPTPAKLLGFQLYFDVLRVNRRLLVSVYFLIFFFEM